jgi:membrane protease YdiL (CAAX protease family)
VGDSAAASISTFLRPFGISARLPLVAWNARRPVPWTAIDLLTLIGLYIIGSAAAVLIADDAHSLGFTAGRVEILVTKDEVLVVAGIAASLLVLLIGLPLFSVRSGATPRDFGWSFPELGNDLKLGLTAFVMFAPPVYVIQGLLVSFWQESKHPLVEMFKEQPSISFFAVLFVSAAIVAPLFEEIVFRVLLQGFLEKIFAHPTSESPSPTAQQLQLPASIDRQGIDAAPPSPPDINPYASPQSDASIAVNAANTEPIEAREPCARSSWLAIVVSSAIFAALHYSHGPDWIPLFFLALGLGYLYQRTHRLLPSLVVHSLLNALSMWGLWVTVHQPSAP